ncbi:MAG: protein phosphatase 2C domain-containing protein [Anaerolineae bacterium]|nr:protein phosphatase 2C domain-containing protein [Anaerolineae bacterium]
MSEVHPHPAKNSVPPLPPVTVWGTTDKGRVREGNEDTVYPHSDAGTYPYQPRPDLLNQKGYLLLVADGVGGAQAGSEASRWVRRVVVERYYDSPDPNPATALPAVIAQANAALHQYLQSTGIREAGSTIVAAVIHQNHLYVAHVGDSRAYLLRNGQVYRLTQDHTLTQLKLLRGLISPEQAATDPDQGVLVRSLGAAPTVQVDVAQPVPLAPGDVVLLCSDGLTDVVSDAELADIVRRHPNPKSAARELVKLANRRGGPDNITVAIARLEGRAAVPKPVPAKVPRAASPARTPGAGKGFLSLRPYQRWILGILAALVVLVFGLLGAAIWLTRGGLPGGGGNASPTPTVSSPVAPAPGYSEPTATATIGGTPRPTATPAPTFIPTPTRRPPTLTPTPTPTPTPTATPTGEVPPSPVESPTPPESRP